MIQKAWKKNIAILLVVAMMLTIMPVAVFAEGGEGETVPTVAMYDNDDNVLESLSPAEEAQAVTAKWTTEQQITTVYVSWSVGDGTPQEVVYSDGAYTSQRDIQVTSEMENITAIFSTDAGTVLAAASCSVLKEELPLKTLNVDADVDIKEGVSYQTIQEAINFIDTQEDKEEWTINVATGIYDRFTVLNGLNNLTVQALENATVEIQTANDSPAPVEISGAFPDTAGVSIRQADGVTLKGLTFSVGTQSNPWYSASVSNYSESGLKGNDINIIACNFEGSGLGIGVFINTGTTKFTVQNCNFDSLKEAVSMYGDGTLMDEAIVTDNIFENCSFAIHGYYGGTGKSGVLTFADNNVTGTEELYTKIVIQDQLNTGALKANVCGNKLTNAIVGLVNLREEGETISPVLSSNTFDNNSFYVEAIEPGNIHFYASYQAPSDENGKWVLTGKEDFDVDWGKNPDGSTAVIEELVAAANASGSKTLNIAGIDSDNLIKTFTWFKDGIYWETDSTQTPDVPPETKHWDKSKSKTATNLEKDNDGNYKSQVTLSLPAGEEQLVSDVVFVLDKSTSADLETQAIDMLSNLKQQIENTNAKVNVGVVIFNKIANVTEFKDLTTEYDAIVAAIKQEINSGTNTHAGLLAGKAMLDADTSVSADRKYLIFVSDGITYMYNAEPTATAWSWKGDSVLSWAGPDNWNSKYGSNAAPKDWMEWLKTIKTEVEQQGTQYEYPYDGVIVNATPVTLSSVYANSIDKALYLTYTEYQSAVAAGYHCYAMVANQEKGIQYEWGPSFMSYLADGKTVDFSTIQNDIYYLLDAGSRVEDYMGYVADDYNFDFVDADSMVLKVGEESYEAVKIDDNHYGFKPIEIIARDAASGYAYEVTYDPGNLQDEEHFVWTINVPVSNFAPVQLTYTVQLMNPKTAAGTYGEYDADGSQNKASLYTNNRATLYPVDTNDKEGEAEDFNKPTVSYTVEESTTPGGGGGGGSTTYTDRTVTKLWKNDDAANRPSSITINVLNNGEVSSQITLSEANDWIYS